MTEETSRQLDKRKPTEHSPDIRKVRIAALRGRINDYEHATTRSVRLRKATEIIKWANALLEWEQGKK